MQDELSSYNSFHRDFYIPLKTAILKSTFTFLLGPKKCGKTICLKQLEKEINAAENAVKAEYIDLKLMNLDQQAGLFADLQTVVKENRAACYLLDGLNYVEVGELLLRGLAMNTAEIDNTNTKIVFAGSMEIFLRAWINRAFYIDDIRIVFADFLSYQEYLQYKNIPNVAESKSGYIKTFTEFHGIDSWNYAKECLDDFDTVERNTADAVLLPFIL